jgi:hypothetical protein
MSLLKKFKNLFKKEEYKHTPNPEDIPDEVKGIIENFKQSFKKPKKKKKYNRPRTNNPSTPIQKVNRHGAYGFAIRRANKQNRKPTGIKAYRGPISYI